MNKLNLYKKFIFILKNEKTFFAVTILYGVAISLLTLGVPISVQALVNTVTFGVLLQPLLVIAGALLLILVLSGFLKGLQVYAIEMFQRHFFARTVNNISKNILEADASQMRKKNGVELVNRYFEIMSIQKKVSLLLTDFVSVILQTVVGLILISFYHPYFLIFDMLLVFFLLMVWWIWGKASINTAISESKAKYKVANWLQESARLQGTIQTVSKMKYFAKVTDHLVEDFLNKRKKHFNHLFAQIIFLLLIYAFLSVLILALGGYLVIIGELSIGQLVAVELIITVILASVAKSGKYFESFYDLSANIDKLFELYEIKKNNALSYDDEYELKEISFEKVIVDSKKHKFEFDFKIEAGKNYKFDCRKSSGKSIFMDLLHKLNTNYKGQINYNGEDIRLAPTITINEQIQVIDTDSSFQGTIEENLYALGDFTHGQINSALELVDLKNLIKTFDNNLETTLLPSSQPLWPSEALRFEIAKVFLTKPKFLIIAERFRQIDDERRKFIIDKLNEMGISLIFIYSEPLLTDINLLSVRLDD